MPINAALLLRRAIIAVLTLAALTCAAVVAAFAAQRHAMTRCTATPPNFPRELSRAGTEVTVEWGLLPLKYTCVYETRDRIVRRPPP